MEYIVVDDGSSEKNCSLLKTTIQKEQLIAGYYKKENGGKLSAVRHGLQFAKGKYYMDLDSDDWMDEKHLNHILGTLQEIEVLNQQNQTIIAFGGLCSNKENQVIGNPYPKDHMICNYTKMRADYGVKGDKEEVVLTSWLKGLDITYFEQEKAASSAIQWYALGKEQWLFVNKLFCQKNVQDTPRHTDIFLFDNIKNKNTVRRFFRTLLLQKAHFSNFFFFVKAMIHYTRFTWHGARPYVERKVWIKHPLILLLTVPISFCIFLWDSIRRQFYERA